MANILIAVDLQNDFIDGALGSPEAVAIVDRAAEIIRNFDGSVYVTLDTHSDQYMETAEGRHLPVPHCIKGTHGFLLNQTVQAALDTCPYTVVEKPTFGSVELPSILRRQHGDGPHRITLIGLCTDICVVSNALLIKAAFPESELTVIESACAGVTPESHAAALTVMRSCQITTV
jgi:nicotinamidase-related amidase